MNFFQKYKEHADNINRYINVFKNISSIILLVAGGVTKLMKIPFVEKFLMKKI